MSDFVFEFYLCRASILGELFWFILELRWLLPHLHLVCIGAELGPQKPQIGAPNIANSGLLRRFLEPLRSHVLEVLRGQKVTS